MSSVQPSNQTVSSGSGIATGLKATTAIMALGILVQAILGSNGFFQGEPDLITGHAQLGNLLFLVAGIQAVLAFMGTQKGFVSRNFVIASVVLLLLVVAQIGLGYGSRDSVDSLTWHLPNGVLLMGISTYTLVVAWSRNVRS